MSESIAETVSGGYIYKDLSLFHRNAEASRNIERKKASRLPAEQQNLLYLHQIEDLESQIKHLLQNAKLAEHARQEVITEKLAAEADAEEKDQKISELEGDIEELNAEIVDLKEDFEYVETGYALCGAAAVQRSATEFIPRNIEGQQGNRAWRFNGDRRRVFLEQKRNGLLIRARATVPDGEAPITMETQGIIDFIYGNKYEKWSESIHRGIDLRKPDHVKVVKKAMSKEKGDLAYYMENLMVRAHEYVNPEHDHIWAWQPAAYRSTF
ncbi:hypothetical protein BJ508DRAFT_324086 [Ascobolus immersus RN42]|uniref:Uncharacterized protein n=1 Tax=Ascobolus immersus RN42 TaxID=1160509 RepID=A0A3N4IIY1_ASCIM|nr:hypothetical protein BJ508DRAFT_324086 [Ascobolus immersus RN42]